MMRNFWRRGANALRKGASEKPYAIAIPEKQDDLRRLARLVNLLRAHGIEVSRATAAFKVKEGDFPAGTYLVQLDQPYRGYALDLLTPQKYPADKAPYEPYDDVAWALPVSLGVEVKADRRRGRAGTCRRRSVTEAVALQAATVTGDGRRLPLAGHRPGGAARGARAPGAVQGRGRGERRSRAGGTDYPAGLVDRSPASPGLRPALDAVAGELGLDVRRARRRARRRRATSSTCRAWPCCRPGATRSRRAGCGWSSTTRRSPTR